MDNILSGYTGIFKQPIDQPSRFGPTMYGLTDSTRSTLVLIMLTPECFNDAYTICKRISYKHIILIVPALDALFISGIFNLYMLLRKSKTSVHWVFPDKPAFLTSVEFEDAQIQTNIFNPSTATRIKKRVFDPGFNATIEFVESHPGGRVFYDIIVQDGEKIRYLAQYMDEEKMFILFNLKSQDEIHIAFSSTLYGGANYHDLVGIDYAYHPYLRVHSFVNELEYKYCAEMNRVHIGEVKHHDFVQ